VLRGRWERKGTLKMGEGEEEGEEGEEEAE